MNYAVQARWVLPIDRPPIAGGIVSVADARIAAIGRNVSGRAPVDLGDVALLPGFVNAHTHLEFSLLERPLGTPGMSFPQWIGTVVEHRRRLADSFHGRPHELADHQRQALASGMEASAVAGVAAVGDVSTPGFADQAHAAGFPSPHRTVFLELIGLAPQRADEALQKARQYLTGAAPSFRRGLSPHAPYTVGPKLLKAACALSAEHRVPLAMHLAESREELRLLAGHEGPLVDVLLSLSAWFPEALPLGLRPLDYLEMLQNAHRALIIHGNYLAQDEIEFIAARPDRMTLVFCPRTHALFGHDPYPLDAMLSAGAHIAVGTDSRASNPDLSFLAELRFLARQWPHVSPDKVMEMGTLAAAQALGIDADYGSLTVGKRAAFVGVPLFERRQDPCRQVLEGDVPAFPWPPRATAPRAGASEFQQASSNATPPTFGSQVQEDGCSNE
jgi:cytosine/adenosine deaminase-related metal-dependent hydrolase